MKKKENGMAKALNITIHISGLLSEDKQNHNRKAKI
jgi:hypothetical protein